MTITIPYNTGTVRTGDVQLTDYNQGVVETMGGFVDSKGETYVLPPIDGVSAPPEFEGVPIYFSFPDETIDFKILPSYIVRLNSISPAMSRWHLGNMQYRVASSDAKFVTVVHPITGVTIRTGFSSHEMKDQAVPFDLGYTIQIRARYRNNLRVDALRMLHYAMKKYQPYTALRVKDSRGEYRTYDAFMESPSPQDTKSDVTNREVNFNLSLRVEGELDLNDPYALRALAGLPTINYRQL